ncbi:MAG TPA: methyltransferase domain-containing protein [Candidatus Limnocylindrales bacterium]|nr:methyltransferase domain-containing protein [Candidatus Limnocylindrales bacterium]
MDRAIDAEELLDGPLDDSDALAANLRDLARINRLSGGGQLSLRAVRALGHAGSILDVGTGGADIPALLLADARRSGRRLAVTATDSRQEVLDAALAVRPSLAAMPDLTLAVADGRHLPYPGAAFDIGHASLVLHHLDERGAVEFLTELRRVARLGVVVNDLARGRWFWLGAMIVTHTFAASRFTRRDGPLSVRRAWTQAEMIELMRQAGIAPVATFSGFAHHRYAIAAR